MHHKIDQDKLEQVTALVQAHLDPVSTGQSVESIICADWNKDAEHQAWIDSASAQEIADWLASFYSY